MRLTSEAAAAARAARVVVATGAGVSGIDRLLQPETRAAIQHAAFAVNQTLVNGAVHVTVLVDRIVAHREVKP
jgi:hypothetical protein